MHTDTVINSPLPMSYQSLPKQLVRNQKQPCPSFQNITGHE